MKRHFAFLILLLFLFLPVSSFAQEILISEAAGRLTIPDGFYEIPSDTENERIFYNAQGEGVFIQLLYLKDIYPVAYEMNLNDGKPDEPLYYDSGSLAGKINYFYETYKELDPALKISFTNMGTCAAVKCESEGFTMITVINRYEVVVVAAAYADIYSPNSFTPYNFYPIEQPLR